MATRGFFALVAFVAVFALAGCVDARPHVVSVTGAPSAADAQACGLAREIAGTPLGAQGATVDTIATLSAGSGDADLRAAAGGLRGWFTAARAATSATPPDPAREAWTAARLADAEVALLRACGRAGYGG